MRRYTVANMTLGVVLSFLLCPPSTIGVRCYFCSHITDNLDSCANWNRATDVGRRAKQFNKRCDGACAKADSNGKETRSCMSSREVENSKLNYNAKENECEFINQIGELCLCDQDYCNTGFLIGGSNYCVILVALVLVISTV